MNGGLDGGYRDETRIVHMLQALERIEQETRETSRDKLFFDDRLTRAIMLDFIVLGEAANSPRQAGQHRGLHVIVDRGEIAERRGD